MTETQQTAVSDRDDLLMQLGEEKTRDMLLQMMLIRRFEETAQELYSLGKVHGTMHLSIGQEGTAVGASAALTNNDYLLNTHRGHGHCLAWGSEPKLMMAEILGKENGTLPTWTPTIWGPTALSRAAFRFPSGWG